MLKEKTGIGPGLLFMVLYVSMFSYGAMQPIYVAAKYIGNNGYWGFLLAFLIAIPVIALVCLLGNRFPRKSIIQYLPEVFGTLLGKLIGVIYLVSIMGLMVWASRAIAEEINVYFLSRTPMWALLFVFLAVSVYVAHQGIEGITRLAAFIFPLTLLFSLAAILFSFQNFQLDNIRPIFLIEGLKIPYGSLHLFYPFIPLLTVYIPIIKQSQNNYKIAGTAVFSRNRMVDELTMDETQTLALIRGTDVGYQTIPPGTNKYAAFKSVVSNTKITPVLSSDGIMTLNVTSKISGVLIVKVPRGELLLKQKEEIERQAEMLTKRKIENLIAKLQGLNSDPVGFGDKFRIGYPRQWEKIDWYQVYPGAKFVVKTNFTLKETGLFR